MTATCLGYNIFLPPTNGLRSPKTQYFMLQNRHLKFLWWSKIWKLRVKKVYLYFGVHLNYRDMAGPARYSCGFLDIVQAESITQTGESIPPEKVTTHTHRYTISLCLEHMYICMAYYLLYTMCCFTDCKCTLKVQCGPPKWVYIIVRWLMILSNYSCICHKHPTHPINHTQPNYKWTWLRFGTPKQ